MKGKEGNQGFRTGGWSEWYERAETKWDKSLTAQTWDLFSFLEGSMSV